MKNARLALLLLAISLLSLLAACGNKGDLVRPAPSAESGAGR
jgi:predicted small lipoprotein YifL